MILKETRGGIKNVDYYCDLLLKEDPDLTHFNLLGHEYQQRERFFLSNSIRGYLDHFKENRSFPGIT